jgi:beta-galactosidase beta subunit
MERGNPDMFGNLEPNRGRTLFLELPTDVSRQATASRVTLHHAYMNVYILHLEETWNLAQYLNISVQWNLGSRT